MKYEIMKRSFKEAIPSNLNSFSLPKSRRLNRLLFMFILMNVTKKNQVRANLERNFMKMNIEIFVQATTSFYEVSSLDQRMSHDLGLS